MLYEPAKTKKGDRVKIIKVPEYYKEIVNVGEFYTVSHQDGKGGATLRTKVGDFAFKDEDFVRVEKPKKQYLSEQNWEFQIQ